jgi:hypothetical protein
MDVCSRGIKRRYGAYFLWVSEINQYGVTILLRSLAIDVYLDILY